MRFGTANIDITPPFKTTMGGYASRQGLFDGINDPLYATVIILEEDEQRAVIVAADIISFLDERVDTIKKQLADAVQTVTENVLLNASHTHGGPEPGNQATYFIAERDTAPSDRYQAWLEEQLIEAALKAVQNMTPGSLWYGYGKSAVPMNRRLERDGKIVNAPNPNGEVDDLLQVIAIKDANEALQALGIRLSCHPVATGAQSLITADFPGAFKAACRTEFDADCIPFFLQGAGGDMRPAYVADGDRWRPLPHAELVNIGQQLLQETTAVLNGKNMQELSPLKLEGHCETVALPCEDCYNSITSLQPLLESNEYIKRRYAKLCIEHLKSGEAIPNHIDVRVHTLRLTDKMVIIGIQGEVLVGVERYILSQLPDDMSAIFLGYTDGCASYLPDTRELKRGGYEQTGYLFARTSGPLKPGVEKILAEVVLRQINLFETSGKLLS